MNCVSCNKELAAGSLFCNYCGAKQALICPSCHVTLSPDSLFCNQCGIKVGQTAPPKKAASTSFPYEKPEKPFVPLQAAIDTEGTDDMDIFGDFGADFGDFDDLGKFDDFGEFCELQWEHYAYRIGGHGWAERVGYYNKELYSIKGDEVTICDACGAFVQSFSTAQTPGCNRIFVNCRGIFLFSNYAFEAKEGVIAHYSLNGTLLNTLPLKIGLLNTGYAYGDYIWMIQQEECKSGTSTLWAYDFDAMTSKSYPMPWKTGMSMNAVYGTREKAILQLSFQGQTDSAVGWYLFDLAAKSISCLSDSQLLPQWVVTAPQRYQDADENLPYPRATQQAIRFFDLRKDLMWVLCRNGGEEYLEARTIASPSKTEPLTQFSTWEVKKYASPGYFNGKVMYHSPHYAKFGSIAQDGSYTELKEPASGHGRCEHFLVLGDYVYIDMDGRYNIYQHPNNPNYMGAGTVMPTLPAME